MVRRASGKSLVRGLVNNEHKVQLLPAKTKGDLSDAGVRGGGGDGAEATVGLGKRGGVGDVEDLGAKFEIGHLAEMGVFDEGEV